MNADDRFLLHRARNLSIHLDETPGWQAAASLITELMDRLETLLTGPSEIDEKINGPVVHRSEMAIDTVTIERDVFKTLLETSLLFNFWVENVGRLSLAAEAADKQLDSIQFRFVLNPPGRRSQFPREAVIKALMDIKQVLSVPHYG